MKNSLGTDRIESDIFLVQGKPFATYIYPKGKDGQVCVGILYKGEQAVAVRTLRITADGLGTKELENATLNKSHFWPIAPEACLTAMKDNLFTVKGEVELLGDRVRVTLDSVPALTAKTHFLEDMKGLVDDSEHADFALVCGGQRFLVHRAILSARSPVLRRMLGSGLREAREGELAVKDLEPEVLGLVIRFIYTGEAGEGDSRLEQLLYAADKYELMDLVCIPHHFLPFLISFKMEIYLQVKLCASKFRGSVTPATATKLLLLADRHNLSALKQVTAVGESSPCIIRTPGGDEDSYEREGEIHD
jgi:hypothetical protein